MSNTIFAQCSAPGKAGVSIFRISGPRALAAMSDIIRQDYSDLEPRKLYLRKIYHPSTDQLIDQAMVVYFTHGSSFTGEDSVEIYTHGSMAVIKLMHQALISIEDLRLAEPGEFAKRSFLNGNMDLTAAEGLADLIDAETDLQHKQAIRQLEGSLEKQYEAWRRELMKMLSLMEAYIDFPDEDIPDSVTNEVEEKIATLINSIKAHLDDNQRGERLRNGIKLAIIGKPNVGKSSLINYLMQRNIAIVSDIAGTTRDIIEGYIDIGGYPIILQDTAGINTSSQDVIEKQGIEIAWKAAHDADIKLIMLDASQDPANDLEIFQQLMDNNTIIILNKLDLVNNDSLAGKHPKHIICHTSIKQRQGLDKLLEMITKISENIAAPSDNPQISRARYRAQLERAVQSLERFSLKDDLVLATEDLRLTINAISNITGKITVDEILGEIFSNFCIGK